MNKDNIFFLLGGHDLEMLEIRNILELYGLNYIDRNLKWGASWKDYEDIINETYCTDYCFAGIELSDKNLRPPNSIDIDHHNTSNPVPTSMEQVAGLLGLILNSWQKQVAVNDAFYIPGLIEMGISQPEINKIRLMDRKAQGISEQDELAAIESIEKNMSVKGSLIIVESLTSRYSAITDRLYPYDRLLVYDDTKLAFFGRDSYQLNQMFSKYIEHGMAYSGGGKNGFFGLKECIFTSKELKTIVDYIIENFSVL